MCCLSISVIAELKVCCLSISVIAELKVCCLSISVIAFQLCTQQVVLLLLV